MNHHVIYGHHVIVRGTLILTPKGHNYSDPQKKYFCTGISLGVVLGLISHVVMFFSKNSAKKVSGQKLEKWPIFGLSKLIRN